MATRPSSNWPEHYDIVPTKALAKAENLTVTFINHATVLLQWQGINILTDPIWSERASPFSRAGPKRVHEPGIAFNDLPHIDLVLISHNHYDHLDLPTLQKLEKRDKPLFITGLGNRALLSANGISNAKELDWWQNLIYKQLSITFTPARHFSARWLWDRNETLFGSFVISAENEHVFFGGDTSYGPHFKDIQQKFGNVKLALLPIGAFEPRWFMQHNHQSPTEALQAHEDLKTRISIGIHYATFHLSDESIDTPANIIRAKRDEKEFILLKPGESLIIP